MPAKQTLTEQLRQAVLQSDKTRYRIFMETGIPQSALSRFVHGQGGLSAENIDLVCACIGARLAVDAKPKSKSKSKRKP